MPRTHGMGGKNRPPVYKTWQRMIQRCTNPNNSNYPNYGGRGIKVCLEWRHDFKAFYEHVGDRPEGKTLDRIDNDGDYEPGNVRWATPKEQLVNQRMRKDNTSGAVGVRFEPSKNKWRAQIKRDGKTKTLGYFGTQTEAVKARQTFLLDTPTQ